ncbi:hypothetical protein [Actinacidiphila glaucinigra]|uniref:hypothetical protein n=1 Tax=Actinacidiphila glaucinigra TaxID=235986 RepID=UPI002E32073A|nr:hypothetical protein [Actinacidiphila glaucinigra]
MTEDPMVAALLRERAALVQSGLTDRVADVDEQLRLHGYKPPVDGQPVAAKKTAATAPKGRQAKPAETT